LLLWSRRAAQRYSGPGGLEPAVLVSDGQ
jgi:hypothetical protein